MWRAILWTGRFLGGQEKRQGSGIILILEGSCANTSQQLRPLGAFLQDVLSRGGDIREGVTLHKGCLVLLP
jgi:hypothetical protein